MPTTLERHETDRRGGTTEPAFASTGVRGPRRALAIALVAVLALLVGWLLYEAVISEETPAVTVSTSYVDPGLDAQVRWHELSQEHLVDPALQSQLEWHERGRLAEVDPVLEARVRWHDLDEGR